MKKYQYKIDMEGEEAPARVIRAVGYGKRVLEVGCASGVQSRILTRDYACTVTGIELDPSAAEEAREFCESVIVGDLDVLNIQQALNDRLFDVILLADVLEHLKVPERALCALKEHLAPGGFVVASIPNVVHAGLVLEMINGRFDYRPYGLLDDTHLRFFTKKSIFELFERCGLRITEIDRVQRTPQDTEFCQHPYTESEQKILTYIREQNPECETFQFIVRAALSTATTENTGYALLEAEDRLKDLALTNAALKKQNRQLENQIDWIEHRPFFQLYKRIKGLLR